jgi:mannose-6-phosphate isomerase-like protein (cupin superfamily)
MSIFSANTVNETLPQTSSGAGLAKQAFNVGPGATRPGKNILLRGTSISVKVSGDDNGGGFALFEVPAGPASGPPVHLHHVENECFYVLEGQLKVYVGTELIILETGGSIYLPRMIPHTWQTVGQRPARFLSLAQPAGRLEAYLVALSALFRQGNPDSASMKALFEEYGMEMAGPPLPA